MRTKKIYSNYDTALDNTAWDNSITPVAGSGITVTSDPSFMITSDCTTNIPYLRLAPNIGVDGVGLGGSFRPRFHNTIQELHSPIHNFNLAYGVITRSVDKFTADEESMSELGKFFKQWQMIKYFKDQMLLLQCFDLLKAIYDSTVDASTNELVLFNKPHNEIWMWYKQMNVHRKSLSMDGSLFDDLYGKWVIGYRLCLTGSMGIYLIDKYSRELYVKIIMAYHDNYISAYDDFFAFAARVCNLSKEWMGELG